MSYNLLFIFLVIVTSLFVLLKRSHLKIELYVKMHVLLNKSLAAGSQARFDVINRYTLVRIMIECDRC